MNKPKDNRLIILITIQTFIKNRKSNKKNDQNQYLITRAGGGNETVKMKSLILGHTFFFVALVCFAQKSS